MTTSNGKNTPVRVVGDYCVAVVEAFAAGEQGIKQARTAQLAAVCAAVAGVGPVTELDFATQWAGPLTAALTAKGFADGSLKTALNRLKLAIMAASRSKDGNAFTAKDDENLQSYVERVRDELKASGAYKGGKARKEANSAGNTSGGAASVATASAMTLEACALKVAGNEKRAALLVQIMQTHAEQFDKWARYQLEA